jgi:hypothetical protein
LEVMRHAIPKIPSRLESGYTAWYIVVGRLLLPRGGESD